MSFYGIAIIVNCVCEMLQPCIDIWLEPPSQSPPSSVGGIVGLWEDAAEN